MLNGLASVVLLCSRFEIGRSSHEVAEKLFVAGPCTFKKYVFASCVSEPECKLLVPFEDLEHLDLFCLYGQVIR